MNDPFCTVLAGALLLAPAALAQSTTKLSVSTTGTHSNSISELGASPDTLTPDGRFAVFASDASNLVPGDIGGRSDIFLRDTVAGTTTRVNVSTGGAEANGASTSPCVSDDGRFIAFQSFAGNLAPGVYNGSPNVFVHDRQTGVTSLASATQSGTVSNGPCTRPSISGDGTLIAFESGSTNLVASDTNFAKDVFLRNLTTNTTLLVSRIPGGVLGNAASSAPALSGDGRFLAFESLATNLAPGATAAFSKILVLDLSAGSLSLASVSTAGVAADGPSFQPSISSDGSRIAFMSTASNLATVSQTVNNAFLRDRAGGKTQLINALPNGVPANGDAAGVRLANNGAFAALLSNSSNLTPGHSWTTEDAFLVDLTTGYSLRASVPLTTPGEPIYGVEAVGGVSDDGRFLIFESASPNLLAGDTNDSFGDIYRRDSLTTSYRDVDADTWGNAADSLSVIFFPPTVGYSLVPGDCDDTNPAVHPGVIETCNGVDDDCDGTVDELAWSSYCTAGTSVAGCIPTVSAMGFPSAANTSGFFVQASGLPSGKQAIAIYGLAPTATVYAFDSSSTICVASPRARTVNLPTGGTVGPCMGSYSLDWLAWLALHPTALGNPLTSGQAIYAQVWYRDPGAALNANLTDAIRFDICP